MDDICPNLTNLDKLDLSGHFEFKFRSIVTKLGLLGQKMGKSGQ